MEIELYIPVYITRVTEYRVGESGIAELMSEETVRAETVDADGTLRLLDLDNPEELQAYEACGFADAVYG